MSIINYFINQTTQNQPNLTNTLEEQLKTIFLEKSKLEISNKNGDIEISGEIINYKITPIALNSNETASLNRIEITIKVICENYITEDNSFEQTFNRYIDDDSNKSNAQQIFSWKVSSFAYKNNIIIYRGKVRIHLLLKKINKFFLSSNILSNCGYKTKPLKTKKNSTNNNDKYSIWTFL